MTNNSEGLTPTLRPQLGAGWNRALPAAFGFDNGIKMDGVNDGYGIPLLAKGTFNFPSQFSFELWINYNSEAYGASRNFFSSSDGSLVVFFYNDSKIHFVYAGYEAIVPYVLAVGKTHIVFVADSTASKRTLYINGVVAVAVTTAFTTGTNTSLGGGNIIIKHDELRLYNTALTLANILQNYNNGVGENPFATENLFLWYKYQQFETLDFSALQDNSDIRLGLRDFSGKNCHAVPSNMDTNPASSTYVLQPF